MVERLERETTGRVEQAEQLRTRLRPLHEIEPIEQNPCLSSPMQQTPPKASTLYSKDGGGMGVLSLFLTRFFFLLQRHDSLFFAYFSSHVNFYRTAAVFHARTKTPYFAHRV